MRYAGYLGLCFLLAVALLSRKKTDAIDERLEDYYRNEGR